MPHQLLFVGPNLLFHITEKETLELVDPEEDEYDDEDDDDDVDVDIDEAGNYQRAY